MTKLHALITITLTSALAAGCGTSKGSSDKAGGTQAATKATHATEASLGALESFSLYVVFARDGFGQSRSGFNYSYDACDLLPRALQQVADQRDKLAGMVDAPGLGACMAPARAAATALLAIHDEGIGQGGCANIEGWWNGAEAGWRAAYCTFVVAYRACGVAGQAAGAQQRLSEIDSGCT